MVTVTERGFANPAIASNCFSGGLCPVITILGRILGQFTRLGDRVMRRHCPRRFFESSGRHSPAEGASLSAESLSGGVCGLGSALLSFNSSPKCNETSPGTSRDRLTGPYGLGMGLGLGLCPPSASDSCPSSAKCRRTFGSHCDNCSSLVLEGRCGQSCFVPKGGSANAPSNPILTLRRRESRQPNG